MVALRRFLESDAAQVGRLIADTYGEFNLSFASPEELKRLLGCVGKLEPERQRLVLLAYYNGWSREQLSEKFNTPVNTVKTWLRRSMLEIRDCLGLT